MAFLQVGFFSDVLGMCMSMNVILPQQSKRQIGMAAKDAGGKLPTLYLLHGLSDDHSIWHRRTSIERYVADMNLAVVMPTVHRGFYTDQKDGYDYFTFVAEELPAICERFFPLSDRREDRFAAGLSMGGYGAMKLGLLLPERYAAVASLSGKLDVTAERRADSPERASENLRTFGTRDELVDSDNDLFAAAQRLIESDRPRPRIFVACGTEDFLIEENRAFNQFFGEELDVHYEEGPGAHTWDFWDAYIQKVLRWLPLEEQ